MPRCTVGSRQAEYKSRRVDGREDDIVMRVGNSLEERDEPMRRARRAAGPRSL